MITCRRSIAKKARAFGRFDDGGSGPRTIHFRTDCKPHPQPHPQLRRNQRCRSLLPPPTSEGVAANMNCAKRRMRERRDDHFFKISDLYCVEEGLLSFFSFTPRSSAASLQNRTIVSILVLFASSTRRLCPLSGPVLISPRLFFFVGNGIHG
jgi:hypothetical protein